MPIKLKRVYEKPSAYDGIRILVERLWPRGLKKEEAHVDEWLRDAAPSNELRKWYGHDPAKWSQFKEKYWKELAKKTRHCVQTHKRVPRKEGYVRVRSEGATIQQRRCFERVH